MHRNNKHGVIGKIFWKSIGVSFISILTILSLLITPEVVSAANFNFTQSSFAGGATSNVATHTSNQNNWNQFSAKNGLDTSSTASITPNSLSNTQTSTSDFNAGTNSQTLVTNGSVGLSRTNFTTPRVMANGNNDSTFSLKSDGTLWAWGDNSNGGLGDNTTTQRNTPVQVHGPSDVGFLSSIISMVSGGNRSSYSLKSDGTVWTWGKATLGQLGNNTTTQSNTPVQVHGPSDVGFLSGITAIAAGVASGYAIKSDGTVWAWGYNGTGQLGDNTTTQRNTPVQVHGPSDVGFLSGIIAMDGAYAVKSDGTVWSWGDNAFGQLGDNTTTQRNTPVQVHGPSDVGFLSDITAIALGNSSTYALKSDGTVWAWGYNGTGQLGDNTTTQRNTPVQVHGPSNVGFLSGITAIAGGSNSAYALKSDGTVWAWGGNGLKQLGDNTTTQRNTPVQVHGPSDVGFLSGIIAIAGGDVSGHAIKPDGTVWSWGYNSNGQLGDNTTTQRSTPVQVHGPSDVGFLDVGTLGPYYSSGTFTSSVINLSSQASLTTISYTSTLNSQTLTVDMRAGDTSTPDGTWTSWQTNIASGGSIVGLGAHQYAQYRANFSTANTAVTPTIDSLTINYNQYNTSGDLTSSVYDTNDATNSISKLSWTASNTSTTETVKFQIRSSADNTTWSSYCGYADCSGSTYFSSTDNDVALASNHPLRNGSNDRYFQYKTYFASAGGITPILSSVAVNYVVNATPVFNVDYPTTSAGGSSASQVADTQSSDFGKVAISYSAKDPDTATGSFTPNQVLPSFEYSTNGGSSWTAIPSNNMAAGDTVLKTVLANSYTVYNAVWDAKTTIPNTSVAIARVRVTVNDGEAANNTTSATTADFNLDTQAPAGGGVTFDAGIAGVANSATVSISVPTDLSAIKYMISDDNATQTNPQNTAWTSISQNTTIPWSFDSDIEVKTLKFKFKDAYENITNELTINTQTPIPSSSFIVQDTSNIQANPPYYDIYLGWQTTTSGGFSSYKLEYATSSDNSNYGSYTAISDSGLSVYSTNYFINRNLNSTLYYRYRLGVVGANGNISVRSNNFTTAKPDGVQNYGEGGGGSVATASQVENVEATQNADKTVTVRYKLTDISFSKKVSPSYEAYLFYNIGVTLPANPYSGGNLTVSDATKMASTGYVLVNNEVIRYTGKTSNTLTGLTRGTWAANNGRSSRINTSFFAGTPVWILANGTTPISVTNTTIATGQNGTINWDTNQDSILSGNSYPNVGIKVLVHDNQDALSGPLSSQNDFSENGILNTLNLTAPTVRSTSAIIIWTTSDFADSIVDYGTIAPGNTGAYNLSKTKTDLVLQHKVYLSNLTPSTTYYYKTTSTTSALAVTTYESSFTTTAGPIISNVSFSGLIDTSITITWTTDVPSSSYVFYSQDQNIPDPLKFGSAQLTTSHSVSLTNLQPENTYYYFVQSADTNTNIAEDANDGNFYNFTTTTDVTPPVISNIETPIITSEAVAILWKTNENANGQVFYSLTGGNYTDNTTLSTNFIINHLATITNLTQQTNYYFVVKSTDLNGNLTTSGEQTFTTPKVKEVTSSSGSVGVLQSIYDALVAENEANKLKLLGQDGIKPTISNITLSNITAFTATVSFETNVETISGVNYGRDIGYGKNEGDFIWGKTHKINIGGLTLGTEYHFQVSVINKAGNGAASDDKTFKTKFLTDNLAELKNIDNIAQFQAEIEAAIESILPSLVPPFIGKPEITDITENSVVIKFKTNIKSYPIVSYTADSNYDVSKDNPYDSEMSDTTGKNLSHTIQLIGLKPNTKYHILAKAFSLPQVVGKGEDTVFSTLASKIHGSVVDIKKDSLTVVWTTDEPTSSIVEYKNLRTNITSRVIDEIRNNSHSVLLENLTPNTLYQINISGFNKDNNLAESGTPINASTQTDITAPLISNLKVESTLVSGRTDKAQTVITWKTDEPSTSTVFYEEGSDSRKQDLANKQEDLEFTTNHVVILSALKPGTVYRFTIISSDNANNTIKSPIRTIITPQRAESIVDVIFKNLNETFNFINNVR